MWQRERASISCRRPEDFSAAAILGFGSGVWLWMCKNWFGLIRGPPSFCLQTVQTNVFFNCSRPELWNDRLNLEMPSKLNFLQDSVRALQTFYCGPYVEWIFLLHFKVRVVNSNDFFSIDSSQVRRVTRFLSPAPELSLPKSPFTSTLSTEGSTTFTSMAFTSSGWESQLLERGE